MLLSEVFILSISYCISVDSLIFCGGDMEVPPRLGVSSELSKGDFVKRLSRAGEGDVCELLSSYLLLKMAWLVFSHLHSSYWLWIQCLGIWFSVRSAPISPTTEIPAPRTKLYLCSCQQSMDPFLHPYTLVPWIEVCHFQLQRIPVLSRG